MAYRDDFCFMDHKADEGHIYGGLQVQAKPHPSEGLVTLTFMCPNHPDIEISVSVLAAEALAEQLNRSAFVVRRANKEVNHG